jgi:hypothetical protein
MGTFIKTLFGDARNFGVVLTIIMLELVLVRSGLGREAVLLVPLATIGGVAWLARQ